MGGGVTTLFFLGALFFRAAPFFFFAAPFFFAALFFLGAPFFFLRALAMSETSWVRMRADWQRKNMWSKVTFAPPDDAHPMTSVSPSLRTPDQV